MIAIAVLFCVTMVASAPLEVKRPLDFYESQGLRQVPKTSKGGWGYFTTHTPGGNLGYTAMYNAAEKGYPVSFDHLPVSPAAFTGRQPYGTAGVPNYGLGYFPGNLSPAYYPYHYQDASYFPSKNYGFEGNYETKSDDVETQAEVEDVRQTFGGGGGSGVVPPSNPSMNPFVNAMVNFNRFNIMRLAFRNAMMMMLG